MKVIKAQTAGFCFGVKRAVDQVYDLAAKEKEPVYTYGPIIHNEEVVRDLEEKGVQVLNGKEDLLSVKKGTVVIRSHGVSRDVCEKIEARGMKIVDATCPFVKKIHRIVDEEGRKGRHVVIIGSADHPEVQGMHDLIVHNYGPGRVMISLHAEVPAQGNILMLHDAIDNIECELKERLKCDAVIHMDPIVTDDPAVNALKEQVMARVQAIDPALSIHDFRMVAGPTHTNVIFDCAVPADWLAAKDHRANKIPAALRKAVSDRWPDHFCVIQLEPIYAKLK